MLADRQPFDAINPGPAEDAVLVDPPAAVPELAAAAPLVPEVAVPPLEAVPPFAAPPPLLLFDPLLLFAAQGPFVACTISAVQLLNCSERGTVTSSTPSWAVASALLPIVWKMVLRSRPAMCVSGPVSSANFARV